MSNDFDDATQLGSIGHNPSVPSQPGQQQRALRILIGLRLLRQRA